MAELELGSLLKSMDEKLQELISVSFGLAAGNVACGSKCCVVYLICPLKYTLCPWSVFFFGEVLEEKIKDNWGSQSPDTRFLNIMQTCCNVSGTWRGKMPVCSISGGRNGWFLNEKKLWGGASQHWYSLSFSSTGIFGFIKRSYG